MKMKHITFIIIFISALFSLTNESKSKQLFDVVNQEVSSSNNNNNNANSGSAINSIFGATEVNKKSENDILFTQTSEKKTEGKSLFGESDSKPEGKSLFGDDNESEPQSNKFLNKNSQNNNVNNNNNKEKSLFGDDDEKKDNTGKSLFGDSNNSEDNKNNQKGDSKSLFEMDEEPVKPQVQLNDNIKPKINLSENKTKQNTNNNNNNKNIINNSANKSNSKNIGNTKHNNNSSKNINNNKKDSNAKTKSKQTPNKPKQQDKVITDNILSESKSEIEKLKNKVLNLISINKQLMKELDKKKKIKQKSLELSDDLINLIETHQTPIVQFEEKLKSTQEKSALKLEQKEKELNTAYSDVRKNLDKLVEKVDNTKNLLDEFNKDESLITGELKKNYSTDSLTVLNNVQVEGQTNANIINTESVDIGNIKIDLEKISIANPQTEIIVGSEILNVKELIENLEIMEKLNKRCGENLENCVQYNEEYFEEDMQKQNQIIEELKMLRKKTKDIIRKQKQE